MALTQQEIKDIALLARIGIDDAEVSAYQNDLSVVLEYFEALQKLDTENIEEVGHITGMTDVYRDDEAEDVTPQTQKDTMNNVAHKHDGYIKVKSVLS